MVVVVLAITIAIAFLHGGCVVGGKTHFEVEAGGAGGEDEIEVLSCSSLLVLPSRLRDNEAEAGGWVMVMSARRVLMLVAGGCGER